MCIRDSITLCRRLAITTAVLVLLSGVSTALDWYRFDQTTHGVVIADLAMVRKGNSENYEAAYTNRLSDGTEFIVLEEREDWLHIQIGDAGTGWLPTRLVTTY